VKPKIVITVDPTLKCCVEQLKRADGEPMYEEVVNIIEGVVYHEYGELPERKMMYTSHAPFCAWAAVEQLLRLCLHCEESPYTLVYYSDPELLERLKKYLDIFPSTVKHSELREAKYLKTMFNDRYACIQSGRYSICLSRPDSPSDIAIAEELFSVQTA